MKKQYTKPEMQIEAFVPNESVAACYALNQTLTCKSCKTTLVYYKVDGDTSNLAIQEDAGAIRFQNDVKCHANGSVDILTYPALQKERVDASNWHFARISDLTTDEADEAIAAMITATEVNAS